MSPSCTATSTSGLRALTLVLAISALANAISGSNSGSPINATSPFDPFERLRLRATPRPSEPVCCLIPLTSEPLPTAAEFLSFEEWKSKQLELQAQAQAANQTPSLDIPAADPSLRSSPVTSVVNLGETDTPSSSPVETVSTLSTHFRVPLTDRFNYASLDCSARVHTTHRSARSPSAILSSKKDRYMLSPCSANPNFIVVELCDDIRIDTVQLANFEFFSGVFKDFRVSVAQTYAADGQGWILAGIYQAKNIRGVQSFHPLVDLRPFYRYIRIDFLTHYGSEFYCPISLLRVYGLTQMEEWKSEVWQGTSEGTSVKSSKELAGAEKATNDTIPDSFSAADGTSTPIKESVKTTAPVGTAAMPDRVDHFVASASGDREIQSTQTPRVQTPFTPVLDPSIMERSSAPGTPVFSKPATSLATATTAPGVASVEETLIQGGLSNNGSFPFLTTNTSTVLVSNASQTTSPLPSGTPVQTVVIPLPLPSSIPSGESIYRTIMNRLAMLETNTTLYQKYVEEQTLQVREALRRLEEDVGRLEGISKAQQHAFSKTMRELERKRSQMEEERWELLSKVNHLTDEVILEKRLGIAQLCLLLTVLIFMALTRGSRTDAASLLDGTMHRLNSFSRRSPFSSADWTKRRWTSRSRTPTPGDLSAVGRGNKEASLVPISAPRGPTTAPTSAALPAALPPGPQTPRSHLRRLSPRHLDVARLGNSERPIGRLRRSHSHTMPANTPLSAKRFARSAHLHEVQFSTRRYVKVSGSDEETQSGYEDDLDGLSRPRSKNVPNPSSAHALLDSGLHPERARACEVSETESWLDTELGSEPGIDETDFDELGGQEVEVKHGHAALSTPFLNPPPRNLVRRCGSHNLSSPPYAAG